MNSSYDDVRYIPTICESTIGRFYEQMLDCEDILLPRVKIITISPNSEGYLSNAHYSPSVESMKACNEKVCLIIFFQNSLNISLPLFNKKYYLS